MSKIDELLERKSSSFGLGNRNYGRRQSVALPYLTRGWACSLLVQLLLELVTAVALRSKSRKTCDHVWRATFPYLYPPGTWWPTYNPAIDFPFVASYNSLGYNGSILTRPHTGRFSSPSPLTILWSRSWSRFCDQRTVLQSFWCRNFL
jgi:hypothetical protein